MSYSNGRITAPVSIKDVQSAIGSTRTDLGTLCSHNNINKWARYKPERHDSLKPITYQQRKNNSFGLQVPYCNSYLNEIVHDIMTDPNGGHGWEYLKPRGDRTPKEYYRLTDFVRHPSEMTEDPNSDPTFWNLKGYNHNAHEPLMVWLDTTTGMTKKTDSDGEVYYEVNFQQTGGITIHLENVRGDDLHLQDFVNVNDVQGSSQWRPIMQVYESNAYNPWYVGDGVWFEKASSTPLLNNESWDISWLFSEKQPTQIETDTSKRYHICVGVGCCDASADNWRSPDGKGYAFVVPYTDAQLTSKNYPFYFRFSFASHITRRILFTDLYYGYNSQAEKIGNSSTFQVPRSTTGNVFLVFTVTKDSDALHFVGENQSADSGKTSMQIRADETIYDENYIQTSSRSNLYLSPSRWPPENRGTNTTAYVGTGSTSETETLYAVLPIELGNVRNGGMAMYRIYGNIGGVRWESFGNLTIKKAL